MARFACAIAAAAPLALAGADASAQDATIRELMRKVAATETEDGFCATTGWRAGTPDTNTAFRENAVVGSTTQDTFKGGTMCATARVLQVFYQQDRKCLRYQWWACEAGKTCGGGTTLTCKAADGSWQNHSQ